METCWVLSGLGNQARWDWQRTQRLARCEQWRSCTNKHALSEHSISIVFFPHAYISTFCSGLSASNTLSKVVDTQARPDGTGNVGIVGLDVKVGLGSDLNVLVRLCGYLLVDVGLGGDLMVGMMMAMMVVARVMACQKNTMRNTNNDSFLSDYISWDFVTINTPLLKKKAMLNMIDIMKKIK